jgi:medium-chain acyl-[acyl-carrier-protein] hydrolase
MLANDTSKKSLWVHPQTNPRACLRLFCFPYAGGDASIFRTWEQHLPDQIQLCPVQLPGRKERIGERPARRIIDLVVEMTAELTPYFDLPFAFFGHSMGALISFELTRYLARQRTGHLPVHLFVSGHRAPHLPDPEPPIHALPEQEFINELRRLQGTPEEVLQNKELRELLIPLLRADFALCEQYHFEESLPLRCPISVFGGLKDEKTPYSLLIGWRKHTSEKVTFHLFAGNHFFLHSEQSYLLQTITDILWKDHMPLLATTSYTSIN